MLVTSLGCLGDIDLCMSLSALKLEKLPSKAAHHPCFGRRPSGTKPGEWITNTSSNPLDVYKEFRYRPEASEPFIVLFLRLKSPASQLSMAYMKQPIATESVCHGKLQTKWGIRALQAPSSGMLRCESRSHTSESAQTSANTRSTLTRPPKMPTTRSRTGPRRWLTPRSAMVAEKQKRRRAHTKSRRGCLACKGRHVKVSSRHVPPAAAIRVSVDIREWRESLTDARAVRRADAAVRKLRGSRHGMHISTSALTITISAGRC